MKKNDFLDELRVRLAGLSEADMKESIEYYSEAIDDRMEDGLSEEEAVAAIGSPAEIAGDILREMPLSKLVKARVKPQKKLSAFEIVLLILGSPIWLSLLVAFLIVVLSVYIVIWSVAVSLWSAETTVLAVAIAIAAPLLLSLLRGDIWAAVALLGAGMLLFGICIFMFFGCLYATKGMWTLSKKIFLGVKSCFIRKDAVK
ncbi:MAG: DUF1700 domain-containing protein [Clostridia bacterium]|nr:DUF1700 domain-containing protein [Clostridia bacterium]